MKISVVIPVYNVEQYLQQCVESVRKQSHQDLEIILVNDGSTDSSAEICDALAKNDGRIKVHHVKNGGVSLARNIGISAATGDYITFVDSDDWLEAEMYAKMAASARENLNVNVIMCDFAEEKKGNSIQISTDLKKGFYYRNGIVQDIFPTLLVTEDFGRVPIVSVWNCLFKAPLLKNNEIAFDVNLRFSEDYLFMADVMLHAESFYYLKGYYGYHYRQYNISRSKLYQPEWWDHLLYLNRKLTQLLRNCTEYDFNRQLKLQMIHSVLLVSSGIYNCENKSFQQKKVDLEKIFNCNDVRDAFSKLIFRTKSIGLKAVLFTVKKKWALGYILIRKLS